MVRPTIPRDLDTAAAAVAPCPLGPLPMPPSPTYPGLPVQSMPLPGVRCPTCAANGKEVWVIPGRACGNCEMELHGNS
ncbi:hypothetical protein LA080_009004 [Diaporthe eres]|nr:hypothetical protein LA080_009004 [Diaporthe eres]